MTIRRVTVDILTEDAATVVASGADITPGGYWTELDSDAGAASITLPNSWNVTMAPGDAEAAVEGRLMRFKVNGVADRTCVIESVDSTVRAPRPDQKLRVVTGRDWLCEFEDAPVDPPLGLGTVPVVNKVRFDWTHPQLDRTGWTQPYAIGSVYTGDLDPLGNPVVGLPGGAKLGNAPEGWPDVFTSWIWSAPVDGNNSHPVGQTSYFYLPLTLANALFVPVFTCDDYGQLALDGGVIDEGATFPAIQWTKAYASGIPAVSAGTHHICVKGTNGPYGTVLNPACFAFVAYQNAFGPSTTFSNVVARTANGVGSGNPLLGGNWKCLHAPANPPGFTPGKAFRLMFQQAQASGHLPGWTLGFTDTLDSNGNAWPVTDTLTATVSDDSLLDVIKAWNAQGIWDVAARAGTRVLDAYRWRERGNYHLGGPDVTWDAYTTDVARLQVKGKR